MIGNYQAAMVETRRANELQRIEQQRFEDENDQAVLEPKLASNAIQNLDHISGSLKTLFKLLHNWLVP